MILDMGRKGTMHSASPTEYDDIIHPNDEKSVISDAHHRPSWLLPDQPMPVSFATSCFARKFVEIDEGFLRPFFIRKYNIHKAMV